MGSMMSLTNTQSLLSREVRNPIAAATTTTTTTTTTNDHDMIKAAAEAVGITRRDDPKLMEAFVSGWQEGRKTQQKHLF